MRKARVESDEQLERIAPSYTDLGQHAHGGGNDSIPPNCLPMVGTRGPFGYTTMSGMFALLKVRAPLVGPEADEHHVADLHRRRVQAAGRPDDGLG